MSLLEIPWLVNRNCSLVDLHTSRVMSATGSSVFIFNAGLRSIFWILVPVLLHVLILQPHVDRDLMQTFVVFIDLLNRTNSWLLFHLECFFNALMFESARFVSTVMLLIFYVLSIWLVLPLLLVLLGRVIVLIAHETIVVLSADSPQCCPSQWCVGVCGTENK